MKCKYLRIAIRSFIIPILLFLFSSCTTPPTSASPQPPPPATTLEPTSALIRIELTTTSDWADLIILNPENILSVNIISTSGDPSNYDATDNGILLEQSISSAEGGHSVGIIVDYEITAQASDKALDFQLEKGHLNDSFVKFYNLIREESQLIHEVEHHGVVNTEGKNLIAFSINLSATAPAAAKATTPPPSPPTEEASIIFHNGQVVTVDANMTQEEALAIKGEKILAVGSDSEILSYQGADTTMINLEGRTLLPGFIDGHTHVLINPEFAGLTLDDAIEITLSYGLTGVTEMAGEPYVVENLQQADQEGRLRLRVNLFSHYNREIIDDAGKTILIENAWFPNRGPILEHDKKLRVPGIKIFVDGGSPGRGCPALTEPYPQDFLNIRPECTPNGNLYFTQEELNQLVADMQAAGFWVAFHTMGDRGIDTVLNAIEYALDGESPGTYRHAIQHNSLLRPDQLTRYEGVGALASIRGTFNTCVQDSYIDFYGPDRYEWAGNRYALANLDIHAYDEGDFGFPSDYTDITSVKPLNPIMTLYGLVTHKQLRGDGTACEPAPWLARHQISVERALQMLTINPAYAVSQEDYLGSLEPGKYADMIILSDNPLTVASDDLKDLEVWMTMVGGKTEYCKPGQEMYCP